MAGCYVRLPPLLHASFCSRARPTLSYVLRWVEAIAASSGAGAGGLAHSPTMPHRRKGDHHHRRLQGYLAAQTRRAARLVGGGRGRVGFSIFPGRANGLHGLSGRAAGPEACAHGGINASITHKPPSASQPCGGGRQLCPDETTAGFACDDIMSAPSPGRRPSSSEAGVGSAHTYFRQVLDSASREAPFLLGPCKGGTSPTAVHAPLCPSRLASSIGAIYRIRFIGASCLCFFSPFDGAVSRGSFTVTRCPPLASSLRHCPR